MTSFLLPIVHGVGRGARSWKSALLLLAASLGTFPAAARASHPLATDDTGTQGGTGFEVELSAVASRPTTEDLDYQLGQSLALHMGLAEAVDLGVTILSQSDLEPDGTSATGIADPTLDLKWRFLEAGESRPSVAVRLDYKPPHEGPLSTGGHDVGAVLIASWEGDRFAAHANLGGYGRDLSTDEAMGTLFAGATVSASLAEDVVAAGEVVLESGPVGEVHSLTGMAGLIWEAWPARTVSAGLGPLWDSEDGRPGWIATIGFTAAFAN